MLRNEHVTIADAFQLAGVDDSSAAEDLPRPLAGRDPALPLVLLAHHPRTIARAAPAGVDLQLSGYTHDARSCAFRYRLAAMEPSRDDNLRGLRQMVASAPSVAIVRADEVTWQSRSSDDGTDTHVRWTCVKPIAGPVPPASIVIRNNEEDQARVSHMLTVTAPEIYLVGLDGATLMFALEVEFDDEDGRYELVNLLWDVSLDELV